jgi:mono/diheme cytochrome c family protein
MKAAVHLLVALLLATATTPGGADEALAQQHYMLQCQGCHRPDGTGTMTTAPPMTGMVARFLAVPGGREYLVRVPGVATAVLTDAQLAELLNWTLFRFDAAHVPASFQPYTATEVGALRRHPLRTEAKILRASLIAELDQQPTGR